MIVWYQTLASYLKDGECKAPEPTSPPPASSPSIPRAPRSSPTYVIDVESLHVYTEVTNDSEEDKALSLTAPFREAYTTLRDATGQECILVKHLLDYIKTHLSDDYKAKISHIDSVFHVRFQYRDHAIAIPFVLSLQDTQYFPLSNTDALPTISCPDEVFYCSWESEQGKIKERPLKDIQPYTWNDFTLADDGIFVPERWQWIFHKLGHNIFEQRRTDILLLVRGSRTTKKLGYVSYYSPRNTPVTYKSLLPTKDNGDITG